MKKRTFLMLAVLLCMAVIVCVQAEEPDAADRVPESPEIFFYEGEAGILKVENEYLLLTMDRATTQIAVTDKTSGNVWYSNPPDPENDSIANKAGKEKLSSTLLIGYHAGETHYNIPLRFFRNDTL